MPVISDSYMGMFMPEDISDRISRFISGTLDFPFVKNDEPMGVFYLFGRKQGVLDNEILDAEDMAKKSVEQVARDVRLYTLSPKKLDPAFTRENYTKRSLQIAIDNVAGGELSKRVSGDPAILADCFAQHVAHHRQGHYFELFKPLKAYQLPGALRTRLEGRMLLLGFNTKKESLPFKSPLEPFFAWMQGQR